MRAGNPLVRYEPLSKVKFPFQSKADGVKLALVTDIGNDIAYSQRPEQVVQWVSQLTERLESEGYQVIVGGIPAKSLARLHPLFFKTLAKFYYPDGSVSKEQVTRDLEAVELGVYDLCEERGYPHIPLDPDWYSLDRFHLKPSANTPYWGTILDSFPVHTPFSSTWSYKVRRPLFPQRFWLIGKERTSSGRYHNLVPNSSLWVK